LDGILDKFMMFLGKKPIVTSSICADHSLLSISTWNIPQRMTLKYVISKLDIFPLICATDKVWVTELTWFHKNIRSVRNSNGQELNLILKINSQCDVKHILTSPIKTITSVLKILTYIITSITARPVGFAEIVVIMSVSTFKTDVILYISNCI
jgi:hypothetical protein